MKRKIYLHGSLKKYGPVLELAVDSPIEVFRALFANFPESRKEVAGGAFRIRAGKSDLGEDALTMRLGKKDLHIYPVVKGSGGGRGGGAAKVVVGAMIVVAAAYTGGAALAAAQAAVAEAAAGGAAATAAQIALATAGTWSAGIAGLGISYGTIAGIGLSIALSGISQMLSPSPKVSSSGYDSRESPDQRPSFIYNGPVNTAEQGAAIPLVYGRARTGSVLVSAGVSVEQI